MTKLKLNQEDFQEHFKEQIEFLKNSCESFDNGFDGEAKRIALSLRVLLHDTRHSKSLLGLMDKLNTPFLSTNNEIEPTSPLSFQGLIVLTMGSKKGSKFKAMLDDASPCKLIPFNEWWNETILKDNEQNTISRRELVLTACDQDGGAHVDPTIEIKYARLAKENSLGISSGSLNEQIPNPERFTIRQIGHEVLKTLINDYAKKPTDEGADMYIGNVRLVTKSQKSSFSKIPVNSNKKIGRNEKCPCGSGIKYKKCHGKPNLNR